ncbi:hypothetical protein MBLNU230_g8455t1 [Neophaeotheca triangularis]
MGGNNSGNPHHVIQPPKLKDADLKLPSQRFIQDDEWEYELDEEETEELYFTLDLTTHVPDALLHRTQATDKKGENYAATRSTFHAQVPIGDEDEDIIEEDGTFHFVTDADAAAAQAADDQGKDTGNGGSTNSNQKLRILDLHTTNPLVQFNDALYSCYWHTDLGSQIYIARPGTAANPYRSGYHVDVLGSSQARLMAKPLYARPHPTTIIAATKKTTDPAQTTTRTAIEVPTSDPDASPSPSAAAGAQDTNTNEPEPENANSNANSNTPTFNPLPNLRPTTTATHPTPTTNNTQPTTTTNHTQPPSNPTPEPQTQQTPQSHFLSRLRDLHVSKNLNPSDISNFPLKLEARNRARAILKDAERGDVTANGVMGVQIGKREFDAREVAGWGDGELVGAGGGVGGTCGRGRNRGVVEGGGGVEGGEGEEGEGEGGSEEEGEGDSDEDEGGDEDEDAGDEDEDEDEEEDDDGWGDEDGEGEAMNEFEEEEDDDDDDDDDDSAGSDDANDNANANANANSNNAATATIGAPTAHKRPAHDTAGAADNGANAANSTKKVRIADDDVVITEV